MKSESISRRNFLEKGLITTGAVAVGAAPVSAEHAIDKPVPPEKLPREVWIATTSQTDLRTENPEKMLQLMLGVLQKAIVLQPDIVCLPEVFATSSVEQKLNHSEKNKVTEMVLKRMSLFSKTNSCYSICPVYTTENGHSYNAAVVLDRQGNRIGEYRKIHLTENEIKAGLTPGPLTPPVFKTDFGIIGIQICFDMLWDDGWKALRQQGAEIIFWPSAYAGGQIVNAKAWQNKCVIVSSTRKNRAKICDIAGNVVAQTGNWDNNLICASVNLEKAFLHSWPYSRRFNDIREKYGRKIRITNYHEEEWSILESLSPNILIKDILKEFDLKTYEQHLFDSELAQNKARIAP